MFYATSLSRGCGEGCCGGWNVGGGGGGMRRLEAGCGKRMVLAVSRNVGRGRRFGQELRRRRRASGQGLISWWGPCPLEVPGRPKCGQGPRHRIRPCPSEPHGGAVLRAVKQRRGQGGTKAAATVRTPAEAAKTARGTQGDYEAAKRTRKKSSWVSASWREISYIANPKFLRYEFE